MFKKLRNRIIFTTMAVTGTVVSVVFVLVFVLTTRSVPGRPMMPDALKGDLALSLILSGIAIEITAAIVSYFMAEEAIKPVREAYNAQKIFIANASHEIKTPLAAISANLEAADIHGNRWIKNVERETEKLTMLNSELLTLARTDLVTERKAEDTNLREVIDTTLENLTPRLQNRTLKKKIVLPEKTRINRGDFEQILNILMDNAIKYSDSKIILDVNGHKLVVENDGAKISPEALPHVFERFYQADKTSEGVGLGLSIAKSLAERNGWKLSANSGKNTSFILEF
ncbi:HAMP domain-containing histidine kinase [Candidatus Saccharibacteria bacterium]|nr:HAMP domain-containing histidine kinase [Candidatus Saccharibacteria bacterium]MBQ3263763.1 HAMP domain-containing histidine kinase [Candidatus Saccharibacteria bacterium]